MPTDFRQYQDPGVYVESAPFPTVPAGRLSPTVVALVGDTQRYRTFSEVVRLTTAAPSQLTKEGIDRSTITVANRLTGVAYASSAVGRITAGVNSSGNLTVAVDSGASVPTPTFSILVDGEEMSVTGISGSTWTVSRAQGGTSASAHLAGAVVNLVATGDFGINAQGGEDGIIGGSDDTTTVQITPTGSGITSGDYAVISYQYTDPGYYAVTTLRSFDAVKDAYGAPFDDSGAINSEIALGALLAFKNGAERVVCVPVEAAGATATDEEFEDAIDKLNDERAVNVVVPLTGSLPVLDYAKAHCAAAAVQNILRRAFVGMDGVASSGLTADDVADQAVSLASMRVTLVAPTVLELDSGARTPLRVGGQYLAAAVAGLQARLAPQEPLTHKEVYGFYDFTNASAQDTLLMQQSGVTVLYKRRDGRMRIKHGLTTKTLREDPVYGNVYTQEISVITAQDRLHDLVQDMLVNSALIGSVITDQTPAMAVASVQGALEIAKGSRLINSYQGLKYRFRSDDPTAIEIRFEYKPTLPLNYIEVVFSLDTTSGETSFVTVA